ncbi:M14 family zinc carboxypeptidase [Bacillus sp. SH5-2]|uniref:M14 family zinc carboxypeptidase n=1 Tax=Bacillus sp. SH5-2 TaxID=2217834 RepID=UPI0011EC7406|nr:M14 family zinc carboxypeptidase [Bacillus sp. SH5-2]KAA0766392.1 hypothetical protein DN410_02840 [Bacillus sp. SH5-2]
MAWKKGSGGTGATGPQGPMGPMGPQGPAGPQGPKGESGSGGTGGGGNVASIYEYYIPDAETGAHIAGGRVYRGWTVEQYYAEFDRMVTDFPKYVKKETAPYKDMSGTYDLHRWIFTPEDGYDKTIYIGAGVHGSEMAAKCTITRICQLVTEEWEKKPHLAYLRKRVRMVIIPVINPWGHAHNTLVNSNDSANGGNGVGVNCNRNYDGFWFGPVTSIGADHNGSGPFSENETKWVRDTILAYGPENFHYAFDFHDSATASVQGDFWINYNTFHKTALQQTRPLVWYLAKKYITDRPPFIWHDKDTTTSGVFPVWAGRTMGIPASTVEGSYEGIGTTFDGPFMTKMIDIYLNAILVNTIANHKAPILKSNKKWFELEWWKAGGEWAFNQGNDFNRIIPMWDGLATKYSKYMKKSSTSVTSSDGKAVHHYILAPQRGYKKTVLIVGGRTEPNKEPFNFSIAMLRLAELLCKYANHDEHLLYLKENVRIVFVPYLEHTTKYLNSAGNFAADGTPTLSQVNISNIVSIMDTIGTIDGVIYQRELNKTDIYAATTDDSFVLPVQDTTDRAYVESYVDYLSEKGLVAELLKNETNSFGNYVFNKRGINCVRIDTGLDHKMYEFKKYQFDDQFTDTAVSVDTYLKYNHEIARRVNNIVNIIKLMIKE